MDEQTAAPEATDTAAVEPGHVDEVAAATPENAGRRNPNSNQYKQEVENLLTAYETRKARQLQEQREAKESEPEPEPEGLREGESWDSVYSNQPEEVQRAMAEMRKMMTRKTQELAAEKRKIEAQNKALMESGVLDSLKEQAGNAPEDFDPFNADHIQQLIESKVASRLQQILEPLHKKNQQSEAQARYENFKSAHPDLVDDSNVKKGVYEALQSDPSLKLEAAYWMVKGKMLTAERQLDNDRAVVRRRAQQRAALITDRGQRPGKAVLSPDIKDKSAYEIYQTLKSRND
tara:strand:- start:2543 stop:3412 length:870 start_codon:yes stop_codon:yes gene_type:complete